MTSKLRAAPSIVASAGGEGAARARRGRGEGAARARRGRGEEATGGGTLAYLENWYNSNGGLRRHTPPRLRLWPRNEAAVFCCANSVSKALAS